MASQEVVVATDKKIKRKTKMKSKVTVDTFDVGANVDVVRLCLQELHWKENPNGGKCDIHWHGCDFGGSDELQSGKVNRFPGLGMITQKISLIKTLDSMRRLFPDAFDFYPCSWFLPMQFTEFSSHVKKVHEKLPKSKSKPVFIVKPDDGSDGNGIYLLTEPRNYIHNKHNHVVQEYMSKPMLIGGFKFDLRIYVTLLSLDPLEIYIGKEGMVRFCTVPYQKPSIKNLHESFMHLTNYSLNKRSNGYVYTEGSEDGSKRKLSSVLQELQSLGHDTSAIWENIEKLVVKTVLSIVPEIMVSYHAEVPNMKYGQNCFQILGFDILLLENGGAILIEVNSGPSLRIDYEKDIGHGKHEYIRSPVDEEIKKQVVMDTLLLAAPQRKLNKLKHSQKTTKDETGNQDEPQDSPELSCLKQIYPAGGEVNFEDFRIMESVARIFMDCVGVRDRLNMGSSSFRNFIRKCNLSSQEMSTATADILYIDISRKWQQMDSYGTGLCYQGFVEAFFTVALKKDPSSDCPLEGVEKLIKHFESQVVK